MLHLLGYAYGGAGRVLDVARGPVEVKARGQLSQSEASFRWESMLMGAHSQDWGELSALLTKLATRVEHLVTRGLDFCVLGGDHTSAIGTWNGVRAATSEPFGLIWVDAHLDSHTPETSQTGNVHGMPLATLLGHGHPSLVHLNAQTPVLDPKHMCVFGARSYEDEELALLQHLGVKIITMAEIQQKGMARCWQHMCAGLEAKVPHYGVSVDLDAFDPKAIPGVAVPEPSGLDPQTFLPLISGWLHHPACLGLEVVEFCPTHDLMDQTLQFVTQLLMAYSQSLDG